MKRYHVRLANLGSALNQAIERLSGQSGNGLEQAQPLTVQTLLEISRERFDAGAMVGQQGFRKSFAWLAADQRSQNRPVGMQFPKQRELLPDPAIGAGGSPCRIVTHGAPYLFAGKYFAAPGERQKLPPLGGCFGCGSWVTLKPCSNQSIKTCCQAGQTVFYSYAQPPGQGLGKQGEWANEG